MKAISKSSPRAGRAAVLAGALAATGCQALPVERDAWTGTDKWAHFAAGAAVSAAYTRTRGDRSAGEAPSRGDAVGVVFVIGTGKELVDVHTKGAWSYKDMVWNIAGALAGYELAR